MTTKALASFEPSDRAIIPRLKLCLTFILGIGGQILKMMKITTFIIVFVLSSFLLQNAKGNNHLSEKKVSYYFHDENQIVVYVCTGTYAYAYHSRQDCPGLNNCKGEIKYTDEYTAVNKLGRVPCCRCWSNVTGRCKDDNPYNQKSSSTQFNPYIQQLPIDAMVYAARQKQLEQQRQQQAIDEFGQLLHDYFFSPEKVARRKSQRKSKKIERERAKKEKASLKSAKRLKRKSNKNIKKQNSNDLPIPLTTEKGKKNKYLYSTTLDNPIIDVPLRCNPNINADILYICPSNAIIHVIEVRDGLYYKVNVHGFTGFISKGFLSRQN